MSKYLIDARHSFKNFEKYYKFKINHLKRKYGDSQPSKTFGNEKIYEFESFKN